MVNDELFSLEYWQTIDVAELTTHLVKEVGFQNRHTKDMKLAVDHSHKIFNDKIADGEVSLQSIHGVGQKIFC